MLCNVDVTGRLIRQKTEEMSASWREASASVYYFLYLCQNLILLGAVFDNQNSFRRIL